MSEAQESKPKNKLIENVLTGLVILLIGVNIWWFGLRQPPTSPIVGAQAPALSLVTLVEGKAGPRMSLEDVKGKVVLLDFWATWCGPCKKQMPALEKLSQEIPDEEFVVLSVNMDKTAWSTRVRQVASFVQSRNVHFPIVLDDGSASRAYQVQRIPTLILIDRAGNVAKVHTGLASEQELRQHIDELRQGEPDA